MQGIAKLLFGENAARALEELGGDDGWGLADRVRRAGEWCGSTPGRGTAADNGPAGPPGGAARGRPGRRGGGSGGRGR